ncbi:MAG: DUF6786 family protein [Bacteroidales bacterium]|jgi:hypothetical protein
MTGFELIELLDKAYRRWHLIGNMENGVIAALDLEGRLFTMVNGQVINRVLPSAIEKRSNKLAYQNPGGDALWPAPEGTTLGYEYPTGNWRVPPSVTGAVWETISEEENKAVLRAEIDLINNQQTGLPCEFERHVKIEAGQHVLKQNVTELIRYVGRKTINNGEFMLAPWSLCQFDSSEKGKVIIPVSDKKNVWDLYKSSEQQRFFKDNYLIVNTKTDQRFQLGLSEKVEWIEYLPGEKFRVKRSVLNTVSEHRYIDISDVSPDKAPSAKGVKLSVYCDPSGFMEIEACGRCPDILTPGIEMSVDILTEYIVIE